MFYMSVAILLMLISFYLMLTYVRKFHSATSFQQIVALRKSGLFTLATVIASMMTVSPFLASILHHSPDSSTTLPLLWLGLAGGTFNLLVYGVAFLKKRGLMNLTASICGAVMIVIFSDGLMFLSSDKVGLLNFAYLNNIHQISDVQCDSTMIVVHLGDRQEPTEWRCPAGFVLMGDSNKPFMPLPDYTSGKSTKLTMAIYTMMDGATKQNKATE